MRNRSLRLVLEAGIFLAAAYLRIVPDFHISEAPIILSDNDGPVAMTTRISISPSAAVALDCIIILSALLAIITIREYRRMKNET